MATAFAPPTADDESAGMPGAIDERLVLWGVEWSVYVNLRSQLGDRPVRLTFDGQNLEIMSPSRRHEVISSLLGRFVERYMEETNQSFASGGSMTFRRDDLHRGLEPDRCYWIAHEREVRGRDTLDFQVDPPPDLAIEVDITRSSLDRLEIYSQLRIQEIWRCDGARLEILQLQSGGEYTAINESVALPGLPAGHLASFLPSDGSETETDCLRRFLNWARETVIRR